MLQLILTIIIYLIIVIPVGVYLYHVAAGNAPWQIRFLTALTGQFTKSAGSIPTRA